MPRPARYLFGGSAGRTGSALCRRRLLSLLTALLAPLASADDVEPRLYSNVPVGAKFIGIGYAHSEGEITVDSSLPVRDVDGRVDLGVLSYSQGLNLFGKSALFTLALPYAEAAADGLFLGEPVSGQRRGAGDPLFRLAVNLSGAPPLERREFASYRQKTIIGVNLTVAPPLGHYEEERVLNAGSNRWNVVGNAGLSHKTGPWTLEASLGLTWHSDNDEFRGATLSQRSTGLLRTNLLYDLTPRAWIGVGALYAYGGETSLDGADRDDHLSNWRVGVAVSFAAARRHRVQLRATEGVVSRIGRDFRTYGVAYTYAF